MSNRPTKEIKLPSGDTVIFYEYITGRDKREIEEIFLRDVSMKQSASSEELKTKKGGQVELSGLKGTTRFEAENKAFSLVIQSIKKSDSTTIEDAKEIVEYVLDLPMESYDVVVETVNSITDPKKDETT